MKQFADFERKDWFRCVEALSFVRGIAVGSLLETSVEWLGSSAGRMTALDCLREWRWVEKRGYLPSGSDQKDLHSGLYCWGA